MPTPIPEHDRVTPEELDRWHDRFDTWGAVAGPPPLRQAAATIRTLTAERDEARAELAEAQAIVAAKTAIEAWGCDWSECSPDELDGESALMARPAEPGEGGWLMRAGRWDTHATAADWRDLARQVIEQAAVPCRERVEAAGYRLVLHCAHVGGDCPVQVWHHDEAADDSRRMHTIGEPGDYPTRDDCEAAAQWAEAQADAQAAGPPDADDDADLARKKAAVNALSYRLNLPSCLWDAMRRRMTAGHREHAGQDLWGLDLRAEARGEAVDGCNYVAGLSDPTPDDLRAAALFAEAWALLGGETTEVHDE